MGWLAHRGAAGFTPTDATVTIHRPGPEPVGRWVAAVLDGSLGSRINGHAGHVPAGGYGTRAVGELGPRQRFVGAAQLQNKIANALGASYDVAPHGKPAPGTTPETAMSRVLGGVGVQWPWGSL